MTVGIKEELRIPRRMRYLSMRHHALFHRSLLALEHCQDSNKCKVVIVVHDWRPNASLHNARATGKYPLSHLVHLAQSMNAPCVL